MNRRRFLQLSAATAGTLLAGGCASSPPLVLDSRLEATLGQLPYRGLATSLPLEQDYEARVEGELPPRLRGTYFRNGPGLFDRGGMRKRTILDGDGMVQQFRFHAGGVRYRTRFVRTEKYRDEEAAGRFIYPSWSTEAPGGLLNNFWVTQNLRSQAGITVYLFNGRLYTFDESSYPYEMDPDTLDTVGETSLGIPREETIYSAHSKFDPRTGEWLHFGVRYGAAPQLHISVFRRDGSLNYHRVEPMPRFVYLHDWFVSTTCLVVSLQPVDIDFWPALLGLRSISDSLRWRPEKGNLLLVVPRDGATPRRQMEAPACFMWHSVNARDDGREITADFIGYDNPDHFVGPDPLISAVMQGREGDHRHPGLLRRYRIDLQGGTVGNETFDSGNCEWPRIDDRLLCAPYRFVWTTRARPGDFFPTGIARHDMQTGRVEEYDFGGQVYCSEPYFVPQPAGRPEEGWVLTECLDGRRNRSFLAVLDAGRLADGPLAVVQLEHHVPFSYHGCWRAEGAA